MLCTVDTRVLTGLPVQPLLQADDKINATVKETFGRCQKKKKQEY